MNNVEAGHIGGFGICLRERLIVCLSIRTRARVCMVARVASRVRADRNIGIEPTWIGIGDKFTAVCSVYMIVITMFEDFYDLRTYSLELARADNAMRIAKIARASCPRRIFIGNDFATVLGKYMPVIAVFDDFYNFARIDIGRVDEDIGGSVCGIGRRFFVKFRGRGDGSCEFCNRVIICNVCFWLCTLFLSLMI